MNMREFENLIAAYGVSPARWPDERREAGVQFMQDHPEATDVMTEDAALDALLDTADSGQPSEFLRARIMKSTTGRTAPPVAVPTKHTPWRAIAASLVAACVIGAVGFSALGTPEEVTEEAVWLEAANELGVSDIYAWVEGEDTP